MTSAIVAIAQLAADNVDGVVLTMDQIRVLAARMG
jgi:hypothetical protein